MIIPPPRNGVPEEEVRVAPVREVTRSARNDARLAEYLKCTPWKCDKCGTVMFGRCENCVYCKIRYNKHVLRPT